MQGRGSEFPSQGLTQVARRKQCFSGWQQSTGRDEQKLPDFFLQDELPALLGVAGAFVLHGLGRGTFLGKGSQSSPSVAPQKCSCYYQDGRSSFSCIPVRPGMERASWGYQEWGAGTSTAGKTCLEVESFPGPSLGITHLYLGPSACPSYRVSPRQSGKLWQVTSLYFGSWQDFNVNWRDYRVKNWSCNKLKVEKYTVCRYKGLLN